MLRLPAVLVAVLVLSAGVMARAQDDQSWPLVDVSFEGLQRYAHADIVRLSGMVTGQPMSAAQLTTLAQELTDTGLFTSMRYRYETTDAGIRAVFTVTESAWTVPVVFDNFIGLPDDQLIPAVAAHVPAFDGTAVEDGRANELIATALEQVLAARGMTGRVTAVPRVDLASGTTVFAFAAQDTGVDLTLCEVRIPGASEIDEDDLVDFTHAFIGRPYSRSSLQLLASGTLLQHYRQRGYWAAGFGQPTGEVGASCDGVTASIPVAEGVAYRFAGAEWTGNSAVATATLDDALDMKTGALADASRIDEGLRRVKQVYLEQGYLLYEPEMTPELDASSQQATFMLDVNEGPQFRMGTFSVEGLPDRVATDLTDRFELKPGNVFDGTYLDRFMTDQRQRIQQPDGPFMTVEVSVDPPAGVAHVKLLPAR